MKKKERLTRNRVLNYVFVLTFTLILFFSFINIPKISAASVNYGGTFQFIEHDDSAFHTGYCIGVDTDELQFESGECQTFPSYFGSGYAVIVFGATNFNDVNITITARKNSPETLNMLIYDGDYNVRNFTQFPIGSGILPEGNGLIQTLYSDAAVVGTYTAFTFTTSYTATFDYVTLIVGIRDEHIGTLGVLELTDILIYNYTTSIEYYHHTVDDPLTYWFCCGQQSGGYMGTDTGLPSLTLDFSPPPTNGYIGGIFDNTNITLSEKTSYIYVANVDKSIMINQTIYKIMNYTNVFGNTWVTIVLYTASNNAAISPTNPLKAIWSETTVIENGTFNLVINHYPNIISTDNQYVAIGFSSSEVITISGANTTQTMYTYPVYAPYSIDYLNPSADTLGFRFLWNMIIPDTSTENVLTPVNTFDVLNELNALAIRIGIPSMLLYSIMFIIVILGTMIIISNAKREAGDFDKLPPVVLASFSFAILAFFSVTNMLPFEILIFAIVGVSALSGLFIAKTFLGNG